MTASAARGRVLMLLSALCFAGMGLAAKSIPPPVTSAEKVFFRSLIGTLMLAWWIWVRRNQVGRPVNYWGLLTRGTFGAVSLLCFFYAIDEAGLTKATLYCYTYPVWAAVIAWFDQQERPSGVVLGWLGLAMGGVLLTLTPEGGFSSAGGWVPVFGRGDVVGLIGGMLSGAAITSVRRLHRTDNSTWIVLAFTGISTVTALPMMSFDFAAPGVRDVFLLFAVGGLAVAAQAFMTSGYRHVRAVEGSLIGLSIVPISALLGTVVLGEELTSRFWMGAALVFSAAVGSSLHATRRQHLRLAPPGDPADGHPVEEVVENSSKGS